MNRRNKGSEILLDAIGDINERFIYEAEAYIPVNHKLSVRKYLIAAFSVVLIMSLMLSLLVGTLSRDDAKENANGNAIDIPDENEEKPTITDAPPTADKETEKNDNVTTVKRLSSTLDELKEKTLHFSAPLDREIFFDGNVKLIWKYEDENEYRICTLSTAKANEIKRIMKYRYGFFTVDPEAESNGLEGFWICYEDGSVISPYLKTSSGNVAYGDVFEYERELEPSAEFAKLIESIVSKN